MPGNARILRAHAAPLPLLQQFRPLTWRTQHPYILADRFEDLTDAEAVRQDPLCDRRIAVFGYLRGCNLKPGMQVHLAGVGDFAMAEVSALPDPCPLPGAVKRRSLDDRERLLYAPMSDVGRLTYDKDAMYVNLADHTVNFTRPEEGEDGPSRGAPAVETPGVQMVRELQDAELTLDEKLQRSRIQLFRRTQLTDDGEGGSGSGSEDDDADEDDADELSDDDEAWSDEDDGAPADVAGAAAGAARVRRRAVFDEVQAAAAASDSSSSGSDSDGDAYGDVEGMGGAARWKDTLARRAAALRPKVDLMVRIRALLMP